MWRRIVFVLPIVLSFFFFLPSDIHAKKTLPIAGGGGKAAVGQKYLGRVSKGAAVSVKFRGDRKAIIATFSNLDIASSVSYTLSYSAGRGIKEGAGGTISDLGAGSTTRELLFATCSNGVCRYHTGIKDARFVVTTTRTDGKKVIKSFRLRV